MKEKGKKQRGKNSDSLLKVFPGLIYFFSFDVHLFLAILFFFFFFGIIRVLFSLPMVIVIFFLYMSFLSFIFSIKFYRKVVPFSIIVITSI